MKPDVVIPSYPFREHDGGRFISRRAHEKNTCAVVALSIATCLDFDQVYDDLMVAEVRQRGTRTRFDVFVHQLEWNETDYRGFSFIWRSFPARKGQRRMNAAEFCKQYPKGNFIIEVSRHLVACIDGVICDIKPMSDRRCIYGAWEVVQRQAKMEIAA